MGISVDRDFSKFYKKVLVVQIFSKEQLNFPLLYDFTNKISRDYGVYINEGDKGVSFRGTFVIDTKQIIRHITVLII